MARLFGGKTPSAPAPPPVPTLSDAGNSAAAENAALINAQAVGSQQTVLTTGLSNPKVRKGSTLLGGTT